MKPFGVLLKGQTIGGQKCGKFQKGRVLLFVLANTGAVICGPLLFMMGKIIEYTPHFQEEIHGGI